MFEATWGDETFEIPYSEMDWPASAQASQGEPDWVSKQPTPSRKPKKHECLRPNPCTNAVAPEPTCVQRDLPPCMAAPKLNLDENMELLSRVRGAGDEDPHLSALSAALKTILELSDSKKPSRTLSPGVELLTRDVKSYRGIGSPPIDTCPSPYHPRERTLAVCNVGEPTEAEMKSYGLAALAPLAIMHPCAPSGGTGNPGVPGRGTKAIV